MRHLLGVWPLHIVTLLATFLPVFLEAGPTVFRIPKVEGIVVDGLDGDWARQGFRVEFLTTPEGEALPLEDFDIKFRLGWNLQGLYVLATVYDDIAVENEDISRLWRNDCVEILMAEKVGYSNLHQLVIASGADPKYGKVRNRLYDHRPQESKTQKLSYESASRLIEGGSIIEAMLPWANLGLEAKPGMEFAFQFLANDDDAEAGGTFRIAWFPAISPTDPTKMHTLRLDIQPSEPVLFRVDRKFSASKCELTIQGVKDLINEQAVIRSGDQIIREKKLATKGGRAYAIFSFDLPEKANPWPQMSVEISGKQIAAFDELPTLGWILERYIQAIGGREAIEKLTVRSCKGRYFVGNPPQSTFQLEAQAKIPDKWATSIQNSDWTEKNGFDGRIGWRQNSDRIERYNSLSRSILGWWLIPQGPLQLEQYFPGVALKNTESHEGRTVYVVESASYDGERHTLEFDAETGLLFGIDDRWQFEEYRQVDNILFPFQMIIDRSRTFILDEVKHNIAIGENLFSMPDAAKVFADAFQGIDDLEVLPMLKTKDLTYEHGEMNIPCRDGRFLYDLIIRKGYKQGLEIGTYNGYSTLWFGLAFRKTGGKVITLEIDPLAGQEARQNFLKAGLDGVIDSRIADAFAEIPRIEGEFDFVFIDANKEDYGNFLKLFKHRVKPGGAIVAHNALNYAQDMHDFLDTIQNDPDFETTIHKTSAEGMSVSIKRQGTKELLTRTGQRRFIFSSRSSNRGSSRKESSEGSTLR